MIRIFLLAALVSVSSTGFGNTQQILAVQQAQIAKLLKKVERYPDIDLLKLWIANRVLGNTYEPADGGSTEITVDSGTITLQTPTGSHHSMVGLVHLEAGTYQLDLIVVPTSIDHNWTIRSDSLTKTATFYARVSSVTASVPAIEATQHMRTVTGSFNGTTMTSKPLNPAFTISSEPGALTRGTHEVWMSFSPYPGAKKLQIVSAILRRLE